MVPEGTFEIHLLDQNVFYFDIESFLELNAEELTKGKNKLKSYHFGTMQIGVQPVLIF